MTTMMHEQDELQVLQTIRSLTLADFDGFVRKGKESGSTEALRTVFDFAKEEAKSAIPDLSGAREYAFVF